MADLEKALQPTERITILKDALVNPRSKQPVKTAEYQGPRDSLVVIEGSPGQIILRDMSNSDSYLYDQQTGESVPLGDSH